jgi:hypothetical protein
VTRLKWAGTSVGCAALAALVLFGMRIGPVLMEVSDRYDQGVHLGDLLLGAPLALAALVTGVAGLTTRSGRR